MTSLFPFLIKDAMAQLSLHYHHHCYHCQTSLTDGNGKTRKVQHRPHRRYCLRCPRLQRDRMCRVHPLTASRSIGTASHSTYCRYLYFGESTKASITDNLDDVPEISQGNVMWRNSV
jgi:hypothetical protein